jgi:hypothetical protein
MLDGAIEDTGQSSRKLSPPKLFTSCQKVCSFMYDAYTNALRITDKLTCEISSSHGGEYEVQNFLLGCTAV